MTIRDAFRKWMERDGIPKRMEDEIIRDCPSPIWDMEAESDAPDLFRELYHEWLRRQPAKDPAALN